MNIIDIWIEHDLIVKGLIIALGIVFIMAFEKIYNYYILHKTLKKLNDINSFNDLQNLENGYVKDTLVQIKEFKSDSQTLFHSFVNVKIDMYEQYVMKYITTIGIIAVLAPMLGLIGTFIGVWHVFEGVSDISLSDPAIIAKGIKEVLVDTMSGLIVAVISMVFYKTFEYLSAKNVSKFEEKIYKLIRDDNAKKS
jgi:biopolymer transport protein ExbB/TolQ